MKKYRGREIPKNVDEESFKAYIDCEDEYFEEMKSLTKAEVMIELIDLIFENYKRTSAPDKKIELENKLTERIAKLKNIIYDQSKSKR